MLMSEPTQPELDSVTFSTSSEEKDNVDFISHYLQYVGETEVPTFFHRWCCISMLGAYLGRQFKFNLGSFEIHPNKYVMLIGSPGTRKSTAIKTAKKLLTLAGYEDFSADKSSKEKFLLDLAGEGDENDKDDSTLDDILDRNIFGGGEENACVDPAEMYIACDEFNNFIGNGNIEFISLLGELWDYAGVYKNRIKSGKSVVIPDPTISILGGNTPVNFARAFPTEIIGQGFFSRLLLIHGENTGRRITFPARPDAIATAKIVRKLQNIKTTCIGEATLSDEAYSLLDKIYKSSKPFEDIRFESYMNRRFTHLIKLCLIIAAAHASTEIQAQHVIEANTILTHTENLMPRAMGEFGKSKNSDILHKVVSILDAAEGPLAFKDIWEQVSSDIEKPADLGDMLRNLSAANKIQTIQGMFLPKKKVIEQVNNEMLDYGYLTTEEREM